MATYSMPTDESLVRVAKAIETGNGLLQRVIGGYVMFTSAKPAESSITTKPCLVIVTTTGEMYLVADDLQAAAKANAWPDEEEDGAKAAPSWDEDEDEEPTTVTVDESMAGTPAVEGGTDAVTGDASTGADAKASDEADSSSVTTGTTGPEQAPST